MLYLGPCSMFTWQALTVVLPEVLAVIHHVLTGSVLTTVNKMCEIVHDNGKIRAIAIREFGR